MSKSSYTAYPEIKALFEGGRPNYQAIPRLPHSNYNITVQWTSLAHQLEHWDQSFKLDLSPDYQRGHVWTPEQQTAFVEYQLLGGESGRKIIFVAEDWARMPDGMKIELLDGKQRLTAVQAFLAGEIPAFGHYIGDWEGHLRGVVYYFEFQVIDCPSREDRLRLYLQHNGGGVVHSQAELDRMRALLAAEKSK